MSRLHRALPATCLLFVSAVLAALLPAGDHSVRSHHTTPAAPCIGDGTDGRRIMLVYARVESDADQYESAVPEIRTMAARVSEALRGAGGKVVRWYCSGGSVSVARVTVPSYRLASCRSALQEAGYRSTSRMYVCFMRTSADGFNGQAEIVHDADAKVSPSPHDSGPRYASIYSLAASSAGGLLHEFGHLVGAVQCSAPHSSCPAGERGHHHCYEEQDIMCLKDGGSYYSQGGAIVDRCPDASTLAARWDCGRDDYFNPDPAPGSYLATHWNTYDSLFLAAATAQQAPAPSPSTSPTRAPIATPTQTPTPTPTKSSATSGGLRPSLRWVTRVAREGDQGSARR